MALLWQQEMQYTVAVSAAFFLQIKFNVLQLSFFQLRGLHCKKKYSLTRILRIRCTERQTILSVQFIGKHSNITGFVTDRNQIIALNETTYQSEVFPDKMPDHSVFLQQDEGTKERCQDCVKT